MTYWFSDRRIAVRDFPPIYKPFALYAKAVGNRKTGAVRGGSFLLRHLTPLGTRLGATMRARVKTPAGWLWLDFRDPAFMELLNEALGSNPVAQALRSLLHPGHTFIDIGANYGSYTMLGAQLVGPSGRVIAVEPMEGAANHVRESAMANGFHHVHVHQCALSNYTGGATFLIPDETRMAGLHRGFSGINGHREVAVQVRRLSELESYLPTPAVVKLDVEGSEYAVLEGGEKFFRTIRPPILLELNPRAANAAGKPIPMLLSLLAELGYTTSTDVEGRQETVPILKADQGTERNVIVRQASRRL